MPMMDSRPSRPYIARCWGVRYVVSFLYCTLYNPNRMGRGKIGQAAQNLVKKARVQCSQNNNTDLTEHISLFDTAFNQKFKQITFDQ